MLADYNIYKKTLNEIDFDQVRVINTINPHSYCIAKQDISFDQSLKSSDILIPDGIGIVLAHFFLYGVKIKKIAGFDLFLHIMNKLNKKKSKIFFLGSSEIILENIKINCKNDFPKLEVAFYSPPYKSSFSKNDTNNMIEAVNAFNPDVLFVGMTAPKQEKWVFENQIKLKTKLICSVGAVFDFYSGNITRSSKIWIKVGLEWLPRFIKEPKRLFIRNMVSSPKFIIETILFKLFGKGFL